MPACSFEKNFPVKLEAGALRLLIMMKPSIAAVHVVEMAFPRTADVVVASTW